MRHDCTTSEGACAPDHRLIEVLRRARASEAEVDRWIAGVEERLQFPGKRTIIRQDPSAWLEDEVVCGIGPWSERGIGGEPGRVGEHVVEHVADRGQAQRCAVRVERAAEKVVE